MENKTNLIKHSILNNDDKKISELLSSGLDPNYEGGWPIRLAARHGSYLIVKTFLHYRANPHLLGDSDLKEDDCGQKMSGLLAKCLCADDLILFASSGASTLQLAVFSDKHWETDKWAFLLSCCDSSQLADGAAVAIVFHNIAAVKSIIQTGRCNTNIPTTLTGKTVEQLAKGYKLDSLFAAGYTTPQSSPRVNRPNRTSMRRLTPQPQPHHNNLSPSVARFFDQTSGQASLTTQTSPILSSANNERA